MRAILFALIAALCTGCATDAPAIPWEQYEVQCAQRCTTEYSSCVSRSGAFPLAQKASCNDGAKMCAASCPKR